MSLVIMEKMVLTDGITFWGRKPATTITIAAANKEYSIKSWPRWSFQIRSSKVRSNVTPIVFSASITIVRQTGVTYN